MLNNKQRKEKKEKNMCRDRHGKVERVFHEIIRRSGALGNKRDRRARKEEGLDKDIDRKEIRKIIEKLKEEKAAGIEGIPKEALKYGRERLKEQMWDFCNRVQREYRRPENQREGIITPKV